MDTALRIIRITILTTILTTILGSQIGLDSKSAGATDAGSAAVEPFVSPEPLTFDNATGSQIELVNDAIATFEAAGLELPPLVVFFDVDVDTDADDGDACQGHPGFFTPGVPATIQLCTELRHVVLHELAHVWEWHVLDDRARDEFVEDHGLPTWNSRDHAWEERGVERMADTVAIGLSLVEAGDNPKVIVRLCAFETVTGVAHPGLIGVQCDGAG